MTTLEKFNHLKNLGLSVKLLSNLTNIKTSLLYKWTSGSNISIEKEQIINKALDNIQNLFDITEIATDSIKYENIANQKFNHLTALYPVGSNKAGMMQWACQCDCGNPILKITTAYALKNNETISCGCQKKLFGGKNLIDLTGKRFGQLTVLSRADNTLTDNRVQWLCQCDCGNQIVVRSESLISHKTQSCGCLTKSIGEMNIEKLLINNHFNFIKQYSFPDLKSPKNYLLKFDFAILTQDNELSYLIEFDGKQHNDNLLHFNETEEEQKYRKLCDMLKNEYCQQHNIPLLRIPYDKKDNLSLKDILLC